MLSELGALENYVKRVGIMTTCGETKRFSKKECEQLVRARFRDYTPDGFKHSGDDRGGRPALLYRRDAEARIVVYFEA